MALVFAFLALIGWGVGDIFVTLAARKAGSFSIYFWSNFLSLLGFSLFLPWTAKIASWEIFLLAFFLAWVNALGTFAYYRGLEVGNASLVGTLGGAFVLVTVLLSLWFFGEKISFLQFAGIVFIIIGIIFVSWHPQDKKELRIKKIFLEKSIFFGLGAMLFWGIYFALIRISVETNGWFWSFYPLNFNGFFLLLWLRQKKFGNFFSLWQDKKAFFFLLLFTFLIDLGTAAYNIGLLYGKTAVVAPIAGNYPVLFVLLTRWVFKEKLTDRQKLGIAFSLLGIVLVSSSI